MKLSIFLILPFFLLCLLSCDSNRDSSLKEDPILTYDLVKTDSIILDYMEQVNLLDFDPIRDIFLAYNQRNGDYLEFDRKGNILNEVNLLGEGPNDHGGTGSYQVNYLGEGKIGVAGIGRFFVYNSNWKLIDKIDYQPMKSAVAISAGGSIAYLTNSRPQSKLSNSSATSIMGSGYFVMKKEHHKNPHLFSLDRQTGKVAPYHILPDSSMYLTSNTFYPGLADAIISYNYENNVMEIIHRIEPIIYTYDMTTHPPRLIKSTEFEYQKPNILKGVSYETPMQSVLGNTLFESLNQVFTGLYSFEDMQMIQYRERKAGADLISFNETDQEKLREFKNATAKTWTYLVKNGKRVSHDFQIEAPLIALQLGNGKFLSRNYVDPEVERETQLFYIYELREVGK